MSRLIIGFAGRKKSGKTTAANYLVGKGFVRHSFAQPLKAMTAALLANAGLGTDEINVLIDEDKEAIVPVIDRSVRHIMQMLGTEFGRNCIDPDLWVNLMQHRLLGNIAPYIVFDDIRFENEAAMIRNLGGLIIHVERAELGAKTNDHASEMGIMNHYRDIFVGNDDSIGDFLMKIEVIYSRFVG